MKKLETAIPPPLIALVCGLMVWGIALVWPAGGPAAGARLYAAIGLFVAGIAIDLMALRPFLGARTTIHPLRPERTTALVTTGLYRFSRNPMYVGQALALAGFTLWLGHPAGIAAVAAFVAYITRFQIIPEERVLAAKFPEEFAAWQARVRRWL